MKLILPKKYLLAILLIGAALVVTTFLDRSRSASLPYPQSVTASGEIKEISLTAQESEVSIGQGEKIKVWSYNGQVPGPEIRVKKGDTLKINFTNNLPQETTIHFHGIRVPNAMDGVPGVTQEPIKPGDNFTYEFIPKDVGTFWYHPHVRGSEQVERGLYGVIVVENPEEPVYDQDQTIVLDDWRLDESGQIDGRFNTGGDLMHDGRWGNTFTANSQLNYKLSAKAGERLRLRFINTSNARVYKLDFGDLKALGFAVDGMLAKETFDAQGFELAPGNRLDVDISIPMISRTKPYIIRDTFSRQPHNLVTLEIEDVLADTSDIQTPLAQVFPDWTNNTKKTIDKEYRLNARRGGPFGIEWTINDKAYPDYDPITLKRGEYNVIRFTNESGRLHPMHLHGVFFKVLSRNGRPVDEPYLRDTVLIKSKEIVDVGLIPLDEGRWVNHCHILEHAEAGMLTVVEVK
jgi:FtsP/CotA-like multicopper oxidase with cupredoxin domain